ncbi:MAG: hypothetical protein ACD_52C00002G0021 [uncultured bacterium]|uniref:ATP-cone domain-containing protein n=1 Tax=Candidatus Woesebacteria bacterium RIFCSPHIGHO2_12_FULL_41_24 TaxID=1802510 RepID=A0A1F8ARE3_9BACT|nr:MAG: hypothetical protein ACD_52C00002G0021 [uncultured bacterium]OGM13260.1 MAG: hypothetical protein A2W15_05035 [Candidatus Woesebacteria bacterium RBG_16_41_13]OGM30662.1 MAG: hypothetical protein A2873_00930 [Candidatus Woesebacteria bacterium RIFCSPHIGHO2_01_FULL_42_80]OGM35799.1 MAG: hypothetical protein A3D84_00810 [Candidatus Woesebacteria bacterium RIFCSPHIGHO2_02_FULL_42_20]OGM53858.1 MAG: hypothetical protein A3E44_05580 [Candidatus Woesebacteria bacterium RIFCSPHIGHO2_12_FULL_41
MGGVQVRKRDDGSMQPFDRNKVYSSLTAAGANSNEAECLTVLMEHWVTRNVQNEVVKSSDIRGVLIELLKILNPGVAIAFESYKKPV